MLTEKLTDSEPQHTRDIVGQGYHDSFEDMSKMFSKNIFTRTGIPLPNPAYIFTNSKETNTACVSSIS